MKSAGVHVEGNCMCECGGMVTIHGEHIGPWVGSFCSLMTPNGEQARR